METKDLVIIGSPRGKGSNSWYLAQQFIEGYNTQYLWSPKTIFLSQKNKISEHLELFRSHERIIWFFPLYTDAMPGIVKRFLDHLQPEDFAKKEMGYFIISGFPEAHHSLYVEQYFIRLTQKYRANLLGSVIKGGMEGIKMQPAWITRKTRRQFYLQGKVLAEKGQFDPKLTQKMRKMMELPKIAKLMIPFLKKAGMIDGYWNKNLKRYNAYEKRNNKPYLPSKNNRKLAAELQKT